MSVCCLFLFFLTLFRGGRRHRQEEEGRDRKKGKRTIKKDRTRKKGPAGCRKVGYWNGHVAIVLGHKKCADSQKNK